MGLMALTAMAMADAPAYLALEQKHVYESGHACEKQDDFAVNIGDEFTLSATIRTDVKDAIQVLFAKGPKTNGHYELWLNRGEFAFYAPEINRNYAVYTNIFVADNHPHHVAFSYRRGRWVAYLDGVPSAIGRTQGAVSPNTASFALGSLIDGTLPFIGELSTVRIDTTALSHEDIRAIATVKAEMDRRILLPPNRQSNYTPRKYQPTRPLRGVERLAEPAALPLLDVSATTGYSGSIDKRGGNADWDWAIYQDEKGEWVLFEAFGPGCIYNFTQHRYPTSEEPTFLFYIDNDDNPAFSIRQSEFGKKAPFLSPLSDIYEGPVDNGRGPIWVIRSFVPMMFNRHCKVTSSVKLEGYRKEKGEGGWGHVTYELFDKADGTPSFTIGQNLEVLLGKAGNLGFDPKYSAENLKTHLENVIVPPRRAVPVFQQNGAGAIAAVKLDLENENAAGEILSELRLRLYWDDDVKPSVDAPIGTFFGGEYGNRSCHNTLLMIGMDFMPGVYFKGYNYFPMPYWKVARMELYTVGEQPVAIRGIDVEVTPESVVRYEKKDCGYFVSSNYYERHANVAGRNSKIASISGSGHMVYGVLSGYGIGAGCEGDVRVFFDGRQSPEMESDGSESWASYGWGFVTPPQFNPFSGYNGAWNSNSDWSEVRLTLGDSYFFKQSLTFELEHGGSNDGLGDHSGQIFCYVGESCSVETDRLELADETSLQKHGYQVDGTYKVLDVTSAYANGINLDSTFDGKAFSDFTRSISFTVDILSENDGIILIRTGTQDEKRQAATIMVDGIPVQERIWYAPDNNPFYRWRDDSFSIPSSYTAGKKKLRITITPLSINGKKIWTESSYRVLSIKKR